LESSKPPDEIAALDDYFTNRTKQLISHPRSALLAQLVHVDGVVLDGGMDLDGNGDKAEGENTASDRPSHGSRLIGGLRVAMGHSPATAHPS